MATRPQQLIPRRDLDENGNASSRSNGHANQGTRRPRYLLRIIIQPEPLCIAAWIPSLQLHDQLDALGRARRGNSKQILHVDHAKATKLHVMPRELRAGADQDRFCPTPDLDRVVGHQAMAADDQVQGAFALANAAVAGDQHAEAEEIHQHCVDDGPFRPASLPAAT